MKRFGSIDNLLSEKCLVWQQRDYLIAFGLKQLQALLWPCDASDSQQSLGSAKSSETLNIIKKLRDIQGPSFVHAYGTLVNSYSYCETYGSAWDTLRVVCGRFEGRPDEQHLLFTPHSETTQHGCPLDMCVYHRPSVGHLSIVRVPGTTRRLCLGLPFKSHWGSLGKGMHPRHPMGYSSCRDDLSVTPCPNQTWHDTGTRDKTYLFQFHVLQSFGQSQP